MAPATYTPTTISDFPNGQKQLTLKRELQRAGAQPSAPVRFSDPATAGQMNHVALSAVPMGLAAQFVDQYRR